MCGPGICRNGRTYSRRAGAGRPDLDRIFPGDSEMARRMRAFDWSRTPVGPIDGWPQTLRIALGICLSSRFPMIKRIQQVCEEVDRSIDFLVWSLRPTTLDHLGLSAALGELVRGWSDRFRVDAEYETTGGNAPRLPPEVETNVYRIAQESLHNIYKHARATHVAVSLERRGSRAVLTIEDDGRGFDAEAMSNGEGLGLRIMRERAALIGGTLDIESTAGRGTSVLLRFPVDEHAEDSNPVGR
jgi:signal transduction histidine kinase